MIPSVRIPTQPLHGLPERFMQRSDRESLVALLLDLKPKVMVEFGCQEGFTTKVLLDYVPSIEKYIGVDVPVGYRFAMRSQNGETPSDPGRMVKDNPKFQLMIRPHGTLDLTWTHLPVADAVLIDGDHSEPVVKHDTALARQIVRPGGIIFWHDYGNQVRDVERVVEAEYMAHPKMRHIVGTWLAFDRV